MLPFSLSSAHYQVIVFTEIGVNLRKAGTKYFLTRFKARKCSANLAGYIKLFIFYILFYLRCYLGALAEQFVEKCPDKSD